MHTSVVRLNILPAPHITTLNIEQHLSVRRQHIVRDDEVEHAADDAAEDLARKRHARRQLRVLAHLEVAEEGGRLRDGVVAVERGVHVRDGLSGDHGGADHLNEDLDGGRVADGAVEGADDGEEEGGDEEGDDEGPPATLGVSQAVRYGLGRSTYGSPE